MSVELVVILLIVLTLLMGAVGLPAADLVQRRDKVSAWWWVPFGLSVALYLGTPSYLVITQETLDWDDRVAELTYLYAELLSGYLLVLALGLMVSRGLAPGVRGTRRPRLLMPTWDVVVCVALATVLMMGMEGWPHLLQSTHFGIMALLWWWVFGREPGWVRLDAARSYTSWLILLAVVVHFGGAVVLRGLQRTPWDGLDVGWFAVILAAGAVGLKAGRPPARRVGVGALLLLLPIVVVRSLSLPHSPIEVAQLVDLEGRPLQLRSPSCVMDSSGWENCEQPLVEVYHRWQYACVGVVDGPHVVVEAIQSNVDAAHFLWMCASAVSPQTELRTLGWGSVNALMVGNGRYVLGASGGSGDPLHLIDKGDFVQIGEEGPLVPLVDLPNELMRRQALPNPRNWVRIAGRHWTVQQATSICVSAYHAGYGHCELYADGNDRFELEPARIAPYEPRPIVVRDTGAYW